MSYARECTKADLDFILLPTKGREAATDDFFVIFFSFVLILNLINCYCVNGEIREGGEEVRLGDC